MKVALVQTEIIWNKPEENFERISKLIANSSVDLIVLPEMFSTGFSMMAGDRVSEVEKLSREFLSSKAKELGTTILGSFPSISTSVEKPRNNLAIYSPEGLQGEYAKLNLFTPTREDARYEPGDGDLTVELSGVRCSFFICFDLRFPMVFNSIAKDTDLFVVIANWPRERIDHWTSLLKARAIENQAYVVGVNCVGGTEKFFCPGQSLAIGPKGEILAQMNGQSGVAEVEVAADVVKKWREEFRVIDG